MLGTTAVLCVGNWFYLSWHLYRIFKASICGLGQTTGPFRNVLRFIERGRNYIKLTEVIYGCKKERMQLFENTGACGACLRLSEYWIKAMVLKLEYQNHLESLKQISPFMSRVPDWIDKSGVGTWNL